MFYTLQSILGNYATFSKEHGENIPAKLKPKQEEIEAALHNLLEAMPKTHQAWVASLLTGLGLGTATFIPATIVSAMGFTATGVAAGSIAAALQASIGNVAAGSTFASLTSAGATGALFPPLLLVGGIGAMGVGGFIGIQHAIQRKNQNQYNRDHQEQLQDLHEKLQYFVNAYILWSQGVITVVCDEN